MRSWPTATTISRSRLRGARSQGYRDHFEQALTLDEIDEGTLMSLFGDLESSSRGPYAALKAEIDRQRACLFGVRLEDLRPWHYGDPFFQYVPKTGDVDMDELFVGKDPTVLAKATYGGLGMEVRE